MSAWCCVGLPNAALSSPPTGSIISIRMADASVSLRAFMLTNRRRHATRASFASSLFLGLDLSPDGRSVIYSAMRIQSNLMLAEGVFR